MIDVTILTATFNRAHTLERLANSISEQTSGVSFEWLVIDDGSTDETEQLIDRLAASLPFAVRYCKKENGGKHTAFNRGVALAQGTFILTVDSDDQLHPEGLRNAMKSWETIPVSERHLFQGVVGLCVDDQGKVIGDRFPTDIFDSSTAEVTFRYRVTGDKSGMHLAEVFRKRPFPERDGMKFIPEGRIWMEFSNHYRSRYVNAPFVIVNLDAGSNLSSLDKDQRLLGDWEYHGYMLDKQIHWARHAPLTFFKSAIIYNYATYKLQEAGHTIGGSRTFGPLGKFFIACAWPLAIVLRTKFGRSFSGF